MVLKLADGKSPACFPPLPAEQSAMSLQQDRTGSCMLTMRGTQYPDNMSELTAW
jgi:hypothetical protein